MADLAFQNGVMSKVDAQAFLERYESSGMSQKKFAEQEGMSAPMVSYYLRKARRSGIVAQTGPCFSQLIVSQRSSGQILITTPSGLKIEIPI